ncbi:MAG TPA: lipid-A-disaccharide synthase [Acidobacteriota bacterium]|jgi:lipid-A-disaccharide synthase
MNRPAVPDPESATRCTPISVLVVAGEASGDLHASNLCRELMSLSRRPVELWGSGGERLEALGARLLASTHQLGAIGPAAAMSQLHRYYKLYRAIVRQAEAARPDLTILVDFPDFNLPLARAFKKRGIGPIAYFISPQLWAWRRWRVRGIARDVDKMIVLLPFEVDFYRRYGVRADYFGHPLASRKLPRKDRDAFVSELGVNSRDVLVAVLPGSRRREIGTILPAILSGARRLPADERARLHLVVACAPGMEPLAREISDHHGTGCRITFEGDSERVLVNCDYALVKSGTSTLEAGLAEIPFCIVYKTSPWTSTLVRLLVETEHYGLPNLILNERVVPELMQGKANPRKIAEVLSSFVNRDARWETVRQKLHPLKDRLFGADPYRNAALALVELSTN